MSGDDELMLNFAAPSAAASKGKRPQSSQSAASSSKRPRVEAAAPVKRDQQPRPRQGGGQQQSRPPASRPSGAGPSSRPAADSRSKPTTFISSLFSKTPQSDVLQTDEDQEEERRNKQGKAKPTNAPALDASTFAGLGLDPLLVAHLESKRMSIGSRPTGIQRAALPALLQDDESRDALVHAQTGSGKTLTYLLPIIQSLLPLCTETWIDRSVGTLAIILAPTRELARQIYEVAEKLCQLHLSLREVNKKADGEDDDVDDEEESTARRTRWLVPGLLSGGSTKNHEKSRLRKGIPLLVATPGRLLDHLQNTSSFDVGKCRWLVLDEADRLLEMGFKETLEGILKAMDGRRRLACNTAMEAMQEERGSEAPIPYEEVEDGTGVKWWAKPRKVVLCSATLDENVQTLAGTHLRRPQVLRGAANDLPAPTNASSPNDAGAEPSQPSTALYPRLAAPAQLRQNAVIVPPKLRLVTLIALLRSALSRNSSVVNADARRVIVFVSCTDSVEFLWNALGGVKMGEDEDENGQDGDDSDSDEEDKKKEKGPPSTSKFCELFPSTPVYRLHGSLPQSDRIASLKGFSAGMGKKGAAAAAANDGAILLCTSVAARGLDLPSVGCVIQLDPPTEGGPDEYLHRIGRTARVGKEGESWIMFLPHEREARQRLEGAMQKSNEEVGAAKGATSSVIAEVGADYILKRGFGGRGDEYESRATEVQLAFERWVLKNSSSAATLARKAFLSHIRAYATHPSNEKDLFHVRFLHLGHLAKSFALREAPDVIKSNAKKDAKGAAALIAAAAGGQPGPRGKLDRRERAAARAEATGAGAGAAADGEEDGEANATKAESELQKSLAKAAAASAASRSARNAGSNILDDVSRGSKNLDAEARMYAKVRALGKQSKKGGMLGSYGADEFQIA